MDLFEAIYLRQSIGKVKPDPVPRELIEKMLAAAAQAPNHYKVRPWRFVVMTGAALRAPVLIAVGVDKPREPKVVEIENVCAAAAATQNMLLAAQALGLATYWRTGRAATDPDVKAFLGFEPDQHVIGFIYVGYPLAEPGRVERLGPEDRTVWMD